ncbi:MAG: hypothetical protein AABX01_03810 [Candidatus Micrarchaeota archaeon]
MIERNINSLLKIKIKTPKSQKTAFRKAALYDFNGTLVSTMTDEGMRNYERKLGEQLGPLMEIGDDAIIRDAKKEGFEIMGKNLGKKLSKFILQAIKTPRRGTKAREAYYDFMELALERGEMKIKPVLDAFAKGNFIESDRREGLKLISLSRGTDALLQKSLKASGFSGIIEKMYSSIPYGGEKGARGYFEFYLDRLNEGISIVKCYEDEWRNVEGLVIADIALAAKLGFKNPPFEIYWIDRGNVRGSKEAKAEMVGLNEAHTILGKKYGWKMQFDKMLQVYGGLIAK